MMQERQQKLNANSNQKPGGASRRNYPWEQTNADQRNSVESKEKNPMSSIEKSEEKQNKYPWINSNQTTADKQ